MYCVLVWVAGLADKQPLGSRNASIGVLLLALESFDKAAMG